MGINIGDIFDDPDMGGPAALQYKGTWNASTNTPTLSDDTGEQGDFYIVSVAGTQDLGSGSIEFLLGDWALHNGSVYEKVPNAAPLEEEYKVTRDLGNAGLDYVEIGSFQQTQGTFCFIIAVASLSTEIRGSDYYLVMGEYNQTSGAWQKVFPLFSQEDHSQLVANINNDTLSLRLIAITSSTGSVSYSVRMLDLAKGDAVFTPSSGSGSMSFPSAVFETALIEQSGGIIKTYGDMNMNSNSILSVTDPTQPQSAATKNYVDVTHGGVADVHHAKYTDAEAQAAVKYKADVSCAGATPVQTDFSAWSVGDRGIGIGTGGKIFLVYKDGASSIKYVELS